MITAPKAGSLWDALILEGCHRAILGEQESPGETQRHSAPVRLGQLCSWLLHHIRACRCGSTWTQQYLWTFINLRMGARLLGCVGVYRHGTRRFTEARASFITLHRGGHAWAD